MYPAGLGLANGGQNSRKCASPRNKNAKMSLNNSFFTRFNEFNEICRTCLKGGQLLTYLYDEENNINLVKKLKSCTALQFDKNDQMPNKICPTCIEELLQAYNFINKCQISDATLKKYFMSQSVAKIEDDAADSSETVKIEADADAEETFDDEQYANVSDISIKDEFVGVDAAAATATSDAENLKKRKRGQDVFECSVDLNSKKRGRDCDNGPLNNTFSVDENQMNDGVARPVRRTKSEMGKENFAKVKSKKPREMAYRRRKKKFTCIICSQRLGNVVKLLTHIQSHTETKNDQDSNEAHLSQLHLTEQITKQNPKSSYRCQVCWQTLDKPELLLDHYKQHITKNKCEYCGKLFMATNLRKHIHVNHTGTHPYKCVLCRENLTDADALRAHKTRLHCPDKLHTCPICSCTFDHVNELKMHGNDHVGHARPFICETCREPFDDAHTLIAHKIDDKCGRFYLCLNCPKVFQQLANRNLHKIKHN